MLNTAVKAARKAGSIITRASFDVDKLTIRAKQKNDFVSEVDHAAEDAIISVLRDAYPDHGFLGEESGYKDKDAEYLWIIDPLDGTTNFLHGFPQFCVSIGLLHKGTPSQAVVFDPNRNELFTASRGVGAYLNDRRIRVSKTDKIEDALMGTGFPFREIVNLDDYVRMLKSVMKTCAVGGQAIGTAAALWLRANKGEPDIVARSTPENLRELQQTLMRDDAFLPGLRNEDPLDLALQAKATASNALSTNPAAHAVDGITRDLKSSLGAWAADASHAWESAALPATLRLELPSATSLREIHLTFDTGFERQLCLSASDSTTCILIRGPQPETVKHYRVLIDNTVVAEDRNNFLRKRVHRLAVPVAGQVVAIECLATHGVPHARIFEVRLYA